ncbi:MAG: bifunctional diguanylate cyclase/phosphodiesterase [Pseudomonadota bacterium]
MKDGTPATPRPSFVKRLKSKITQVDWMMMFPVLAAIAWLYGEEAVAMVLVAVLPAMIALDAGGRSRARAAAHLNIGAASGRPIHRRALQQVVDDVVEECQSQDRTMAVMQVQVDDLHIADGEWGATINDTAMERLIQRVSVVLRGPDIVLRSGDDCLMVALAPTRRADLDVVMNIVDRIQAAISEPLKLEGRTMRVHSCIGICTLAMAPAPTGAALLAAADCALRIARRQGDDSVRAFNPDIQAQVEIDHRLASQIDQALEAGHLRPWFQPQIDGRTGAIVGFEALARWHHPDLGVLSPAQFLGTVTSSGRSAEMGEAILKASLEALRTWDRAGIDVPSVGINLSLEELTDPRLAERIIWEVDRYDLAPERVAVEILETVTLRDGDETIMRNLTTLRNEGFRLDLDDFGTGAASIAHIARFGVHRIKIDRSFISGLDKDEGQRKVVSAILSLAKQLDIDTLAEGVETPEEQDMLGRMGCPHLQGFGIARPMPLEETIDWALRRSGQAADGLRDMHPQGNA